MHHPHFSWLCPLKYQDEFEFKNHNLFTSGWVGWVLFLFSCWNNRSIMTSLQLPDSSFEKLRTPSTPDLHARYSGGMEESAWMPKHALELYWWLLFKAGSEGLKEQTRQHFLCLKARGWWIRETSGNISNTPPMSQKHCYVYLPHLPSKTDAKWAIMSWQLSKIRITGKQLTV